jgi:hypothetical protein
MLLQKLRMLLQKLQLGHFFCYLKSARYNVLLILASLILKKDLSTPLAKYAHNVNEAKGVRVSPP